MVVSPDQVRSILGLHGTTKPQTEDEWSGQLRLPDEVVRFYREVGPVDLTVPGTANSFFFPSLRNLWSHQAGYRWDGNTGEEVLDWSRDWLVIADEGADPFIFNLADRRVLWAMHGTSSWDAGEVYEDLFTMAACIGTLGRVIEEAGLDLFDDECNIVDSYKDIARAHISELLGDSKTAEPVLEQHGWL